MGTGYLQVAVTAADFNAIPIPNAAVTITKGSEVLFESVSDDEGVVSKIEIQTPDKALTVNEDYSGEPYALCDVAVKAEGFAAEKITNVKVLDTQTSTLIVNMIPLAAHDYIESPQGSGETANDEENSLEIKLGEHQLVKPNEVRNHEFADAGRERILREVIIPMYITVHLGSPSSNASNVTVTFRNYIKNVCSNEIYATWPEAAIEANIYCQISLALNRVYTEWYRSRGYSFDITNDTGYDQYYVHGSNTFANINSIVDHVFNRFVRRTGHKEPFYTEYCDGKIAQCPGLKQWGSVYLANQGYNPLEILKYYYPDDIQIVETDNIQGIEESYPGYTLKEGTSGDYVRQMQTYLNRIRINFPTIPQISNPNGYYGADTTASVKAFQRVPEFGLSATGNVGKATWYKISYVYSGGVKRLAELTSEGEVIGVGKTPPTAVISEGSRGTNVGRLQYLLNYIANFYPEVPFVIQDYNFGRSTTGAVKDFQKAFRLTQDGIVGPGTWRKLYTVYWELRDKVNVPTDGAGNGYPGYNLSVGNTGDYVRKIQSCLNNISARYPAIGKLAEDGRFGNGTKNAVVAFQRIFGLTQDGIVGRQTWNKIISECQAGTNTSAYPGYIISQGSSGNYVAQIQRCLNRISSSNPSIPRLTEDGNFGGGTKNAVTKFQSIFGLKADGIVGKATWDAIMRQCSLARSVTAENFGGFTEKFDGFTRDFSGFTEKFDGFTRDVSGLTEKFGGFTRNFGGWPDNSAQGMMMLALAQMRKLSRF
ncbi:MAG: peptidoglycan-binding protein [Clostridiales bacterium]|jgi:peptidoglycan hydrolase-like protein with peptidoglycan-binding domain|nr:peptidoglycan-binding protein [Clostridiales bacterium]